MPGIYKSPDFSFIDGFVNAAKYRDQRTAEDNRKMMEGLTNAAKGATQAYLFQQRKNAMGQMDALNDEEAKLRAELDMLWGDQGEVGGRSNFDAIMAGLDYNLMPHAMNNGGLL